MDSNEKYLLRVKTCIGTIIEVHKLITGPQESETFLSQFKELGKTLNGMDMSCVSEGDVERVERATNALLFKFQPVFETGHYGPVYSGVIH